MVGNFSYLIKRGIVILQKLLIAFEAFSWVDGRESWGLEAHWAENNQTSTQGQKNLKILGTESWTTKFIKSHKMIEKRDFYKFNRNWEQK